MMSERWRLIYEASGAEVHIGDRAKDFRGEEWRVTGGSPPKHPGSTGRVWVDREDTVETGYFPSVMKMKWVEISPI